MARPPEPAATATPWLPRPWVVRATRRESDDVVTLTLEPLDGSPVDDPSPGRFMMLYAFGVGEVPISIAGVGPGGRLRHTVRDVGAVTHALCGLAPGDVLGARGPFGRPWPLAEHLGDDLVLVAGGIGLAPLRPLLEERLARPDAQGAVTLVYGAREPAQLLYAPDLARWRERGVRVEVTVDRADRAWEGHVGVVTTLVRRAPLEPDRTAAFVCGPEVMQRFVAHELVARGLAPARIHFSLERNMKCALGLCGRCQLGPEFVCRDGPVLPWSRLEPLLRVPQL